MFQVLPIPIYSDAQYTHHLHSEAWSRPETDLLFELARRFDLRFGVMRDRWDTVQFPNRSVEDLKERYYNVCSILNKVSLIQTHTIYVSRSVPYVHILYRIIVRGLAKKEMGLVF